MNGKQKLLKIKVYSYCLLLLLLLLFIVVVICVVSLPRLIDFDWSVNIKSASDTVAGMAVPTCLVQMKVQSTPETTREMAEVQSVNVEFSKETLDTMLDGLSKIRDQLSSVAKSSS
jgi:hypothetical protein